MNIKEIIVYAYPKEVYGKRTQQEDIHECWLAANSTILDLKYYLSHILCTSIFNIDITRRHNYDPWGYSLVRNNVLTNGTVVCHHTQYTYEKTTNKNFSTYSKVDLEYIKKKYGIQFDPIITNLEIVFYKNTKWLYNNHMNAKFLTSRYPNFILDPLMTGNDLMESIRKIITTPTSYIYMETNSTLGPLIHHDKNNYTLSIYSHDIIEHLTDAFVASMNDKVRLLSAALPNHVIIKYHLGDSKEVKQMYVDSTKTVDHLRSKFDKPDTRLVTIHNYKTKEQLDYTKKISEIKKTIYHINLFDKIPLGARTNDEIMTFAKKDYALNYKNAISPVIHSLEVVNKRKKMFKDRVPYDFEITLCDALDEFHTTKLCSAIIMMLTEDSCMLELMQKNKNKYDENTKNGVITVDISDPVFDKAYSPEVHKLCLETLIEFCYINMLPGDLNFYIKYSSCLLNWSKYLQVTSLTKIVNTLTGGENIAELVARYNKGTIDLEKKVEVQKKPSSLENEIY
jgi:hypothetical protein